MNKTQLDKTLGTIKNYVDTTKMNYLKYTSNVDVNTLKTTGIYSLPSNCTNNGTTNAGTLIIDFNVGTPYQLWIPDNTHSLYKRNWDKTNSVWKAWTNTYTGNVTGSSSSCTGNAATATKLATARTISLTGDVTGSASFDGSANASITTTVGDNSHNHNEITAKTGSSYTSVSFSGLDVDRKIRFDSHITKSAIGLFAVSNNANAIISINRHEGNHISQLGFSSNGNIYYRDSAGNALTDSIAWKQLSFSDHTHNYAGSSSAGGSANSAVKLQTARKIGKASFDGTADISLRSIAGSCNITSSGDANKDKYIKFATIDCSGGTYRTCGGLFIMTSKEENACDGILKFYFRTGSAITSTSISLVWIALSNSGYGDRVVAVKVSDGKYDLYLRPNGTWHTQGITAIDVNGQEYLTLHSGQSYVASVTATATSSIYIPASTATKLATARTISLTGDVTGSATFDGSANASITTTVGDNSHNHTSFTGALTIAGKLNSSSITTGNTQVTNGTGTSVYVGNPDTELKLESSVNPTIKIGTSTYTAYHTGNKPTPADIGAAASSHNHTSLTGVTRINFASDSSDSAYIGSTVSDTTTSLDFGISDDGGTDKFRWISSIWNSSSESTNTYTAMSLLPGTTSANLYVTGNVNAEKGGRCYAYNADNSKAVSMGVGGSDVFITNSKSEKYLQLKDDGTLCYSDAKVALNYGTIERLTTTAWFYSTGDTGWYNSTYGGGWYMTDTSWLRAYNGKGVYTPGQMKCGDNFTLDTSGKAVIVKITGGSAYEGLKGGGDGICVGDNGTKLYLRHKTQINIENSSYTRKLANISSSGGVDMGDTSCRLSLHSNDNPIYWNGSKGYDLVTMSGMDVEHNKIRYGSNMGGQAGYITFSW